MAVRNDQVQCLLLTTSIGPNTLQEVEPFLVRWARVGGEVLYGVNVEGASGRSDTRQLVPVDNRFSLTALDLPAPSIKYQVCTTSLSTLTRISMMSSCPVSRYLYLQQVNVELRSPCRGLRLLERIAE